MARYGKELAALGILLVMAGMIAATFVGREEDPRPEATVVLLLILGAAGFVLATMATRLFRQRALDRWLDALPADQPISFGFRTAWLAVRSDDSAAVARAFGLLDVEEIGWPRGMHRAAAGLAVSFVTPPIDGWVLLHPAWGIEHAVRVSRTLGTEVCAFESERIGGWYAWRRVDRGEVVREVAVDQVTVVEQHGERTAVEDELGLDLLESLPEDEASREKLRVPGEGDVLTIAEAWSVNPYTFEKRPPIGAGLIGRWPTDTELAADAADAVEEKMT